MKSPNSLRPVLEVEDLNGIQVGATTILVRLKSGDEILCKILLDAGLSVELRGEAEVLRTKNLDRLMEELRSPPPIEYCIITHAHEDHCGAVPWIYSFCKKNRLKIPTFYMHELTRLQFREAQRSFYDIFQRPAKNTGEEYTWTESDIEECLSHISGLTYWKRQGLYDGLLGRFSLDFLLFPSGHIVGSSMVELNIWDRGQRRIGRLIYTGDLCLRNGSFTVDGASETVEKVREPTPTAVIAESTYLLSPHEKGDRTAIKKELARRLEPCRNFNAPAVLAVYSIDRAANVLVCLREMKDEGLLPYGTPVFLDSPTAYKITTGYENAIENYFGRIYDLYFSFDVECFRESWINRWKVSKLRPTQLNSGEFLYRFVSGQEERERLIHEYRGKFSIFVATSATFQGGPVMQYLSEWGEEEKLLFLLMGKAIPGTRAWHVVEKKPSEVEIPIEDEKGNIVYRKVRLRAKVEEFELMSAHAVRPELQRLFMCFSPTTLLLTHLGGAEERWPKAKEMLEKMGLRGLPLSVPVSLTLVPLPEFHLPIDLEQYAKLCAILEEEGVRNPQEKNFKTLLNKMISAYLFLRRRGVESAA